MSNFDIHTHIHKRKNCISRISWSRPFEGKSFWVPSMNLWYFVYLFHSLKYSWQLED